MLPAAFWITKSRPEPSSDPSHATEAGPDQHPERRYSTYVVGTADLSKYRASVVFSGMPSLVPFLPSTIAIDLVGHLTFRYGYSALRRRRL